MASGKSIEFLGIDEGELLKTYRISTLKPTIWEDIDPSAAAAAQDLKTSNDSNSSNAEDDPLGLLRGPILSVIFLFSLHLLSGQVQRLISTVILLRTNVSGDLR